MKKSLQEIETDAKESLDIPVFKPARQIFFCPVGLVGAGKTTVTRPISKRVGLVRLSSDELRKTLKENGYTYAPVKEIGLRIANEMAREGFSLAFDMDCGNPEVKSFVEKLAQELSAKAIFVRVEAPEGYVFEKFRRHPPSWLASNPQTMIDNYYAQKEKRMKENTKFDYFFTFDTSKPDLEEQIEDCVKKIEKQF